MPKDMWTDTLASDPRAFFEPFKDHLFLSETLQIRGKSKVTLPFAIFLSPREAYLYEIIAIQ
jgi:hypothetical protein